MGNGGSIEFIARSSGSGRGFTVDVLVCDEDQDLTDEELAALLPTISAAPSGNPMVILTGTPPGVAWVLSEVARIQSERSCVVVIDSRGPAADLIGPLETLRVKVTTTTTNEMLDACASMFDRVQNQSLTHPRHGELDGAVAVAAKRNVGDRWAWGRKQSTGDISMLEAVTLALWGTATKSRSKYEDADMVVV
jgi:hypothetical protein